jgi:5-formyltetrahydrofolate cyclo-ligase
LKVESRISMASERVACLEVTRVMSKREVRDQERAARRQAALEEAQRDSYKWLSGVVRMPETVNPSNLARVCGYVEIKHEGRSRRKINDEEYRRG